MSPVSRRQSLRLSLGALAAALARPALAAAPTTVVSAPGHRPARACIVLYMHGGASHIDTFDPKPGRQTGGPFASIGTDVPGLSISEHLPGLAERAGQLAVIRSLSGTEGNHDRARYLMHTGYSPAGSTAHPSVGALVGAHVAEVAPEPAALPGYVAIGGSGHTAGFLGARHGPFVVPKAGQPIRYLKDADRVSAARRRARAELWRGQQAAFAQRGAAPQITGHTDVMEQALAMMDSSQMDAFDLQHENRATRDRYGDTEFGRGCLLARRLVESGVPFVEVGMKGWDTHTDNFERVQRLSGDLDRAMSTLLDELADRGLLEDTLVVWAGDFGRSPRINARGGRDHHPRASSVVLAGGGLTTGQLVGATDDDGREVVDRKVSVVDLMRTVATALGLDPNRARMTPEGRPITTVDGGRVIEGLWS